RWLRDEPERRAERRALGLVSALAVLRFPGHERTWRLREAAERAHELLPERTEIVSLDLRESRALRFAVRIEPSSFVLVPAPRGALDPVRVEHAQILAESFEVWLAGRCGHIHAQAT